MDIKEQKTVSEKTVAGTADRPEPDFLEQYRRCYPRAKKFHVTGDGLVFPDDKKAAEAHQRCIGRGELRTY
ncbi:hypothetical protein [Bacteroides gallinarum]|uniref:hypothetical protein n=1 Tax=Bacteroides gallinarum TaxID=376806 RepID=UPI00035D8D78|nr:hypothetical protein [Bacteroides gallinarum]